MRRALATAVVLCVLVLVPAVPASAGDPTADRKAAQARANGAAARFAKAESALAEVERRLADLQAQAGEAQGRIDALAGRVKSLAVNAYMRGGAAQPMEFDGDLGRAARGQALARYVTLGDTDALDQWRAAREDLEVASAATRKQVEQQEAAAARLRKEKAAAYGELQRLADIERRHLAKVAAERAARERAAKEAAARATRASRSPISNSRPTGVIASGTWVCPVQGPSSFTDTWGAPRSGGRRHQGVDMLARRGTPVVASVSGNVRHHNSRLGGLSYYLYGDDGHTYFGTHLSGYAASGRVAAGTVVGYVGDTGNARGTPHLHFEIHPNGGRAVNPYPTVRKYC